MTSNKINMSNSKSKLTPEEVFNNKKLFSNTIHARVVKVNEEILSSFEKLVIRNKADKKSFLNIVNHYYQDLCTVIFHLRKIIIKIDDEDQSTVCDLQNVTTALNKIALAVQESLNLEIEKLKVQLKSTIADVGSLVEKLMQIVKYDNLHEHKQKVLDCQHDLVISVEALKLYNQHSYLSIFEFEGLIHEMIEKIKNNLIKVKTDHELLEEDFSHYTRHSIQHLQNIVDYMRKMKNTENFHNDVSNVFKTAEDFATDAIGEILKAVRYDNPMSKMLDIIEIMHKNVTKASSVFQNGLQSGLANTIENDRIKHLIDYILVHGLNVLSALNQSILDAILKK